MADLAEGGERALDPYLIDRLPALPGIAARFLELCDDPAAGVADVAAVAQRDPALLARILQLANSPFYGVREPINDVVRAAAILGLRNLKLLGVGFAVLDELWRTMDDDKPLAGLMAASALGGAGAQSFSSRIGTGRDEEAFTAGMLSFVGELALLHADSTGFGELWEISGGLPTARQQHERFGISGARLGNRLLEDWQIPLGLRAGASARTESIADRTDRSHEIFHASVGFGTGVAEAVLGSGSIEPVRDRARVWGLGDADFWNTWSNFRLATRRADFDLDLGMASDLDALVVESREQYLRSEVNASSELIVAQAEIARLRKETDRLEELSTRDPLTEIANRAAYDQRLVETLDRTSRLSKGPKAGLVLFDLDNFKMINDRFGHAVGDRVLVDVAQAGDRVSRRGELFARIGGDEFALIVEALDMRAVEAAGERVRQEVLAVLNRSPGAGSTGVSSGAAIQDEGDPMQVDRSAEDLFRTADDALYERKRSGRAGRSGGSVMTGPDRID